MRTAALRQLSIFFNMAIVIFAVSAVAIFVFIQPVKAQEETPAPEAEIISAEEAAPAPVPTEEEVEQPTETLPTELVEVIQESVAVAPPPEEINEDTAVTAQDLGAASEPRVLPDSPFYIFKRWGRSVRRLVIRNPVARAEEDLRVANQKLLEARRLAELRGEQAADKVGSMVEEAGRDYARIREAAMDIRSDDSERAERFKDLLADRTFKMQRMFDRIEERLPEEALARIRENKEQALERAGETLTGIDEPERLAERLSKAADAQSGSEFKHFKNLEVLKDLRDRVPEEAREAIRRAEENGLRRLKEDIEGAPIQEREKFDDYVRGLPGDAVRHFEIIDDLRTKGELAPDFLIKLEAVKTKAAAKFQEQFERFADAPELQDKMMDRFREGEGVDLRAAEQLRGQVSPEMAEKIRVANDEGINRFREKFAEDPNALRAADFARKALENPDAVDFAVLERIRENLAPEQQDFVRQVEDEGASRAAVEFDRRGDEFAKRFADPNVPQSLRVLEDIKERLPEEGRAGIERAIEAHRTRFEEHIRELDDPRVLGNIQEAIGQDEELKRRFESGDPEFFMKLENRKDDLRRQGEGKLSEIKERVRPLFENPEAPIPEDIPEDVKRELIKARERVREMGPEGPFPTTGETRPAMPMPFGPTEGGEGRPEMRKPQLFEPAPVRTNVEPGRIEPFRQPENVMPPTTNFRPPEPAPQPTDSSGERSSLDVVLLPFGGYY